jgi:hypothetical protein
MLITDDQWIHSMSQTTRNSREILRNTSAWLRETVYLIISRFPPCPILQAIDTLVFWIYLSVRKAPWEETRYSIFNSPGGRLFQASSTSSSMAATRLNSVDNIAVPQVISDCCHFINEDTFTYILAIGIMSAYPLRSLFSKDPE